MTRRELLKQLHERMAWTLCEHADGAWAALDDQMTMADYGLIAVEMSRFANEHRDQLPMPKQHDDD